MLNFFAKGRFCGSYSLYHSFNSLWSLPVRYHWWPLLTLSLLKRSNEIGLQLGSQSFSVPTQLINRLSSELQLKIKLGWSLANSICFPALKFPKKIALRTRTHYILQKHFRGLDSFYSQDLVVRATPKSLLRSINNKNVRIRQVIIIEIDAQWREFPI